MNAGRVRHKRHAKRKGFIVKGISRRHWWDTYDIDYGGNTRQRIKRETRNWENQYN